MTAVLASIPSPSQNSIEIGPLTIHFYGILIAIGVLVAIWVARRRYTRFGGDPEVAERIFLWVVLIGFLGARLGYVLTHTGNFTDRPWAVFYLWEGGLALYGGLTAGTLTAVYLLHRRGGDAFAFGDAVAVGVPLAQAIGRWGNYFNQELFGRPSDLPWAVEIDVAHRPAEYIGFDTFHPTFLYESLWNLLITVPVILWLEKRGKLYKGASVAVYLILYGTVRFLMELLRTDTTFRLAGLSRNGWISALAVAGGVVVLWWFQRRAEPRTLVGPPMFLAPGEPTVLSPPQSGGDDEGSQGPSAQGPAEQARPNRE